MQGNAERPLEGCKRGICFQVFTASAATAGFMPSELQTQPAKAWCGLAFVSRFCSCSTQSSWSRTPAVFGSAASVQDHLWFVPGSLSSDAGGCLAFFLGLCSRSVPATSFFCGAGYVSIMLAPEYFGTLSTKWRGMALHGPAWSCQQPFCQETLRKHGRLHVASKFSVSAPDVVESGAQKEVLGHRPWQSEALSAINRSGTGTSTCTAKVSSIHLPQSSLLARLRQGTEASNGFKWLQARSPGRERTPRQGLGPRLWAASPEQARAPTVAGLESERWHEQRHATMSSLLAWHRHARAVSGTVRENHASRVQNLQIPHDRRQAWGADGAMWWNS